MLEESNRTTVFRDIKRLVQYNRELKIQKSICFFAGRQLLTLQTIVANKLYVLFASYLFYVISAVSHDASAIHKYMIYVTEQLYIKCTHIYILADCLDNLVVKSIILRAN